MRRLAFLLGVDRDEHALPCSFAASAMSNGRSSMHLVFLVDLVARMRQLLSEIAVVGQQEQTLAVLIQPPDVEHARKILGQQVEHRVALARVGAGREKARPAC